MVIFPESFSIKPETDVTECFKNLFNTISESPAKKTLTLPKGNYVLRSKNAVRRKMFITNTKGEDEYSKDEEKNMHTIALDINGVEDLEIDGNGSTLVLDGKMTNVVIDNCKNITIKNLTIDTLLPNVHKLTVEKASPFYVTFRIDETSNYCEENGNYYWYGTDYKLGFTDYKNSGGWMVTARPSNYFHIKRNDVHPFFGASSIKEVAARVFKVRFIAPKDYEPGQVFYVFPTVRSEVGILVNSSKNIKLKNVTQHFNYSLAFVAQNSENITLDKLDFSPRRDAEVDFTSFADFVQMSMCRGNMIVKNSNFDAAGDDVINVHGFHFKIVESNKDKIAVKFCHSQSYGFECLRAGDTVAYIDPKSLLEVGETKILSVSRRDDYIFDLTLATYEPPLGVGGVIEDISACPNLEFSGNTINRIVTRGVLVTTRGKVLIENNNFLNTGMSGILIADDALNWYESGCVKNVTIRGNAFMNCDDNAILIAPECKKYEGAVHRNITIENNLFVLNKAHAVNVSCADNVILKNNIYRGRPAYGKWVNAKNTTNLVVDCKNV